MRDPVGAVQSVLVLGAGSDIALATVRRLVEGRTRKVVLAARDPERLPIEQLADHDDLIVEAIPFDALDFDSHDAFVTEAFDDHGDFDLVLVAFGVLGSQDALAHDRRAAVDTVQTNYTGVVSVSIPLVERLTRQGHGTLVYLSSVAGERVRKTNYVYGSSKAGMDAFAQGLGDSLAASGVRVMVVRPGFVHTKMTAGLDPAPLSTDADSVAAAIQRGLRRDADVVWVPGRLRVVMSALRHLPRAIFRRLDI